MYFFSGDNVTLLFRAPKAGGQVEALAAAGELTATLNYAPSIQVHNGWVYFEVNFMNGDKGVARLKADDPTFSAAGAEVVARSSTVTNFTVDDDGMYWMECEDLQMCGTRRLMARAHGP